MLTHFKERKGDGDETVLDVRRDIGSLIAAEGHTDDAIAVLQPLHQDLVILYGPHDPRTLEIQELHLAEHGAGLKKERGLVLARYARGLTLVKEIPEAAAKLTEAAVITRQHSSARLTDEIGQARARLEPWVNTAYVRRLDETLRSCGLTSACPAGGA